MRGLEDLPRLPLRTLLDVVQHVCTWGQVAAPSSLRTPVVILLAPLPIQGYRPTRLVPLVLAKRLGNKASH